jgi:uncharacterized membrane protein YeaQ/YmgE (transglycosylase-associated protein family)
VERITEEGFRNFCNVCGGLSIPSESVLPRRQPREDEPAKPRGILLLALSLIFNPISAVSSLGEEMASASKLLQISCLIFATITINRWRLLPGQSLSTFAGFNSLLVRSALTFIMTILFVTVFCLGVEIINKIFKFSDPRWIYLFRGSYFIISVNIIIGIVASSLLQNNELLGRAVSYLVGLWGSLLLALLVDDLYECGFVTAIVTVYAATAFYIIPGLMYFFIRMGV